MVTDLIYDLDAEAADVQSVLDILEEAEFPERKEAMMRAERAFQTAVAWESVERLRHVASGYRELYESVEQYAKGRDRVGKVYDGLEAKRNAAAEEMERDVAQARLLAKSLDNQRRAARQALIVLLASGASTE